MRVKKYLALIFAAILATTMLTACPWDIEDDAASDSSSVPSSSSRPSHDGGSSGNDNDNDDNDDSSSAPSSPSTPDEPKINVDANGALQLPEDTTSLSAEDIKDIKNNIKTVNLTNIDVEQGTFANCDKLETVNITGGTLDSGDEIDGPFNNCEKLETVTLDGVTIKGYGTFIGCESLKEVNLTGVKFGDDVEGTFKGCSALTTVTGADTLEKIPQGMFSDCTSLQYIDISGATSIGLSAFSNCTSLTAVDARGATSIGQSAFLNCDLKHIRVGANLDSIGQQAFNWNAGIADSMELTVHCTGSAEDEDLKDLFVANNVGSYAKGYPQYKYDCNDNCWNQIVSQSQTVVPDTGNALARYLLDLRL